MIYSWEQTKLPTVISELECTRKVFSSSHTCQLQFTSLSSPVYKLVNSSSPACHLQFTSIHLAFLGMHQVTALRILITFPIICFQCTKLMQFTKNNDSINIYSILYMYNAEYFWYTILFTLILKFIAGFTGDVTVEATVHLLPTTRGALAIVTAKFLLRHIMKKLQVTR